MEYLLRLRAAGTAGSAGGISVAANTTVYVSMGTSGSTTLPVSVTVNSTGDTITAVQVTGTGAITGVTAEVGVLGRNGVFQPYLSSVGIK